MFETSPLPLRSIRSPVLGLLLVLAASLAWAYWPVLAAMVRKWSIDPHYSHGFLVPAFVLFLLWVRRDQLTVTELQWSWWSVPFFLAGTGLRLAGTFLYYDWFQAVSLLFCLAGVMVLLGGWPALRWSWQGIAFLLFMIPLPHRLETALAPLLQRISTVASTAVLQMLGRPAVADGNRILVNHLTLEVVHACSGLGTLVVFFALATGMVLLVSRPLVEKMVIVLSTIPIALIANVTRITATALLQETAPSKEFMQAIHDSSGWFMIVLALAILWLELWILQHLFVPMDPPAPEGSQHP